ncbi:cytochrome ubiquinol oxidase subunit I [Thiospirochaeta perfilievii]|uniref:Cytochrome ubiquinol oxidase subunit I n=1 Tax=Thiospirochaeta perfilievii TaxID=252967 RepID=A0A5C1Q751_9SPIO|nr:cytochrome ubiquinol oxidase subunit I [Thiospirochaeta perfilievii]QEN03188.1 cytochrome ubiquinol oxidase subunit I [Thiospirochaeta perfilievii]
MVEILSRIQFAFTVGFHFLFVPLSIGLIFLVCIYEYKYLKSKEVKYKHLSEFYGDMFVINYAFGIVTGITMSLQFGTNWSAYSIYMGDVFGAPLVFEAMIAFFLESTFTGLWIFKKNKMSNRLRFITVLLIFIGTNFSALWIITANGFMQNPVGYALAADGSRVLVENFKEIIFNPYAWYMLVHNNISAILLGSYFVLGIGAYRYLKIDKESQEAKTFELGFKPANILLVITSLLMPAVGFSYFNYIVPIQSTKIDAISGGSPFVTISFGLMVGLGTFFIFYSIYTLIFFKRFMNSPVMQKFYLWTFPLPYIAILAGWIVAEVGRQPYVVYGLMLTNDAVSNVPVMQVWFSLITIFVMYAILAVGCIYLIKKRITSPLVKEESL